MFELAQFNVFYPSPKKRPPPRFRLFCTCWQWFGPEG